MISLNSKFIRLAQAVADPIRMAILQHLAGGAATVTELVSFIGTTQPNVSNHLAMLRRYELVRAARQGRQMVYELHGSQVTQLVEALSGVAGPAPSRAMNTPQLAMARTCYDHLAGRLGVALFDALVARSILRPAVPARDAGSGRDSPRDSFTVQLGPAASKRLGAMGIDLVSVRQERRRFAAACLDWTERRPHLGGALGAALWTQFVKRGWLVRRPGSRVVVVTAIGRRGFQRHFGLRAENSFG